MAVGSGALVTKLAEYVVDRPADGFPDPVRDRARLAVVDTVGCMIGASTTRAAQRLLGMTAKRMSPGATTAFGLGAGVRAEDSALVNGTLGHMLEFDDGHRPSDNHLGAVVVPAALTMAEELGSTLDECVDAIIVGYDAMGRVGEATLLPRRLTPFHGTGTTGVFGAAAVAARLMHLDIDQTAHALAIAGTAAAGLRESTNTGPDCKPLHVGRATQAGIGSAFLAAEGYEGPLTIFEGKHGFCTAMSAEPRPELIVDGLGQRFALLESGIKVHSTCGMVFNILDAVLQARGAGELGPDTTTPIRVGVPEWLTREEAFGRRRPKTGGQARFSIPYTVAAALVDGHVGPAQMREEQLSRPEVLDLEDMVQIFVDDEAEDIFQRTRSDPFFFYPAALEYDHGGAPQRRLHVNPRGYDTQQGLTTGEVTDKFVATVDTVVSPAPARRFAADLLAWDGGAPVAAITAELVSLTGWKQ